ncbi:hypothetical protein LguiA_031553 [Lonicera macranthoides]
MVLTGNLVGQTEIKSDGDVFHELFRDKPHQISTIAPTHIQGCDVHEGEFGKVGSVLFWNYFHDGKKKVAKEVIEAIDEEKKSVTFNVIEGDLKQLYKTMKITVHVDTNGENNLVTWTFDYEKLNETVPDPKTLMDFCLDITKAIETHHLTILLGIEMGLTGKLFAQVEIKSDGDSFHHLFRHKPHHLSKISPKHVQSCDLHEGEFGKVGSVVFWKYVHDGKECVAKEVIEAIDEEKKSITFKLIEGDLLHSYKSFRFTMHVDKIGEKHLVTWTLDYEKIHEDIPHPTKVIDLVLSVTKDIETHHDLSPIINAY